ncbi:aldo/keto reductase [Litoreibacter sp.]|nr:aldo/keto reductase [Litoreibacter sp.]
MTVETIELRPGYEISRVIKGGWQLAGDHGYVDRAQSVQDMEAFLDAGITTFDCADIYVGVEEMIGDFIGDVRKRRGPEIANRARVHTKLVPDLGLLERAQPSDIEAIIDRSLRRLQIEHLHLVQYFWWDLALGDPMVGIETLMRCQEKGKIAHLGVTNWDVAETQPFVDAGCDLVSTQVQYSVLDRRPENGLTDWAAAHGMQLLCYGTLAGGFLTERWLGQPDPGFAFENRSLVKYRLIIDELGPWDTFQELLNLLQSIGNKHDVSLSSVATRWVLDRPQVGAAIVGARTARHLPMTLQVFDFALDAEDQLAIQTFLDRASGPEGRVFALERDRSGRHGQIMKYNLNADPVDKVLSNG